MSQQTVYDYMVENKGRWVSPKEVMDRLNITEQAVRRSLNQFHKYNEVERKGFRPTLYKII